MKKVQKSPALSIITPVYNCKNELKKTLDSVFTQSFRNFELIVIDGGSIDGTLDVLKEYKIPRLTVVKEKDEGIYDAMNKGIHRATGQYLQFLNAGDTFIDENCLASVFKKGFEKHDVIYTKIKVFDSEGKFKFIVPYKPFTMENLIRYGTGVCNHQAFFIRREIAPLYSLQYRLKAELNWYMDIVEQNPDLKYLYYEFPTVNYFLGGTGYRKVWLNLYEWISLVQSRFGLLENIRNAGTYWSFLKYRFAILKKVANVFNGGKKKK